MRLYGRIDSKKGMVTEVNSYLIFCPKTKNKGKSLPIR